MNRQKLVPLAPALLILIITLTACTLGQQPSTPTAAAATVAPPTAVPATAAPEIPVAHQVKPADQAVLGGPFYDVESSGTAPQKRAPYGDSYDINRLERPFLQDMTYEPNLDINTYKVGKDDNWVYVQIVLIGEDPNAQPAADYAVELDKNQDGFGDFIVWATPPYPSDWDTVPVKVYQDTNHDVSGLNATKSDPKFMGNGYDKLVFNGGVDDADPDLAWMRARPGKPGVVEFAFKRSWSGDVFLFDVLADAGLRNPGKLDYVDDFTLQQAGSPIRDNPAYPLKSLFAIDNVCRAAFGFTATGSEPQGCPVQPGAQKKPGSASCSNSCLYGQNPYPDCRCIPG